MNCSTPAAAATHSDASFINSIAESLKRYEADAQLKVPKTDVDYMDAMCAVAKCTSKPEVTSLLHAQVNKRKQPRNPTARYHFSAALEAYAAHVQTSVFGSCAPDAARHKAQFVQACMYRAEFHLLDGYKRDPTHALADVYFRENPGAAQCTLNNVASRMTLASLHQGRLPPMVYYVPVAAPTPFVAFAPSMVVASIPMQQQPPLSPFAQLSPLRLSQPCVSGQLSLVAPPAQPSMTARLCDRPASAPTPMQQPTTAPLSQSPEGVVSLKRPCLSQGLPSASLPVPQSPTGTARPKALPKLSLGRPPRSPQKAAGRLKAKTSTASRKPPASRPCPSPERSPQPQPQGETNALVQPLHPYLKSLSPSELQSGDSDLMNFLESLASENFSDEALDPPMVAGTPMYAKQGAEWSWMGGEPAAKGPQVDLQKGLPPAKS